MVDKKSIVSAKEIGRSGLNQFGGYLSEEFVPELTGGRWHRVVREMTDQDAIIGALLFAIEMLIRQVEFEFKPADDSNKAQKVADFFNECINDMEQTWSDTLSEILSFLPWGWAYLEKCFKYRRGDEYGTPVTEYSRYSDGKVGWRKWAIRSQETLYRWDYNDDTGEFLGMIQMAPPKFEIANIPKEKALHFRSSSRKESPEGKSILRSAWRSWYLKKRIENMEAVSIEKSVVGMPVMWVPSEVITGTSSESITARAKYEKIAKNLRTDDQFGILMPLEYDEDGNKVYDLTLLSPDHSAANTIDSNVVIGRHNRDMAMSVVADFMVMGHGSSTGSFALAASKTELFAKAVGAWMDNICDTVNQQGVPDLMRLNGIDRKYSPTFCHGDIETLDLTELGSYVQKLALAGLPIFEDPRIINYLLEQANMPTLSEEDIKKAIEKATISSQPFGGDPNDPNADPNSDPNAKQQGKTDTGGLKPGQNGYQGPNSPVVTQQNNPSTRQKKKPVVRLRNQFSPVSQSS